MTPETKAKITKGLKTTEFWVVLFMGVLTSIMVTLQDHAETVLPIELQMKILGGLATAYVICRTALKLVGLLATVLRLDRGEPLPVPAAPAGVKLPEMPVPTIPGLGISPVGHAAEVISYPSWTDLREAEILQQQEQARRVAVQAAQAMSKKGADAQQEQARQASLKELLRQAGPEQLARPPVVVSTAPSVSAQPQAGREF